MSRVNKIANEDFVDQANALQTKLQNQLGGDKVIGTSMFYLAKQPDGKTYWVVISNYNEPLTDANLLYLHQSLARHLAKDFSCVDYGPDEEEETK